MLFNTPIFLFVFLPVVLGVFLLLPRPARPLFLTGASLLFYAAGEGGYTIILLASIAANYALGLAIDRAREGRRRALLAAGVLVNLGALGVFKYAGFIVMSIDDAAGRALVPVPHLHLPVGISFFTFMGLAYIIDVYRRDIPAHRNPVTVGLYLALFPHLIAGPIVRFGEVVAQLTAPAVSLARGACGARRFVIGLAKKVLLADILAATADRIFSLNPGDLTAPVAWLGLACYTLQIYFDFSGYSDMAIGLARMFGIDFPENFNYPYVARSLTEFWRRWHMTLSMWLRDYLFMPLGVRGPRWRLYLNVLMVFLICGLWHGANWTFVLWGGAHGLVLVTERLLKIESGRRWPRPIAHAYLLFVVMTTWVLFRASSLSEAALYFRSLVNVTGESPFSLGTFMSPELVLVLAAGAIAATPIAPTARRWWNHIATRRPEKTAGAFDAVGRLARLGAIATLFAVASAMVAAGTYKAFIYFRF